MLHEYEASRSEHAFATLVGRHYLRDWALAFVLYAEAHQGQIPKDFSEAERFLPANFNNRFESGEIEIVYQGSLTSAPNTAAFDPSRTILMREREPRQSSNGRWVRAYAFADGHSEIHSAPTPDGFADWEKERMVGGVPDQ